MLNSKNKISAVEQIIQKVKEEAKNRISDDSSNEQLEYGGFNSSSTLDEKENNLYKIAKSIGRLLKKIGLSSFVNFVKINLNLKKYNYVCNVDELLDFNDEEFVENVYNIVLNRDVDEEGKVYYLEELRTGNLSKLQIIALLHFSDEGKEQNIAISGIKTQYIILKLSKIPILGSFFKIIHYVIILPKIVTQINKSENYLNRELTLNNERHYELEKTIESKIDNLIQKKAEKKDVEIYLESVNYANKQMELTKQNLETLISEAKKRLLSSTFNEKDLLSIANQQEQSFDSLYVSFENQFRGSKQDIKDKLNVYLPFIFDFSVDSNILDVGCGRGEWLELLTENGYKNIKGIDLNQLMVSFCKDAKQDVECIDVITYLKSLDDETLNIITGFHIIEHLPFEVLMALFKESFRVLKKGGMIIFETPNPRNILVGSSDFYLDPTHIKPIHPETLKFLVTQTGFFNVNSLILDNVNLVNFEELPFDDIKDYINIGRDLVVIGYKV